MRGPVLAATAAVALTRRPPGARRRPRSRRPSRRSTTSCRPTRRTGRPTSTTARSRARSRSATGSSPSGKFTNVTWNGTTYTRNSIVAFNATTGAIDTGFVPDVGTKEVADIVDAGDGTVYIGGLINQVNGTSRSKVARINATTGALVTAFKPPTINGARQRHAAGQRPALHRRRVHDRRRRLTHAAGRAQPDHRRRHRHRGAHLRGAVERRNPRRQALRHQRQRRPPGGRSATSARSTVRPAARSCARTSPGRPRS